MTYYPTNLTDSQYGAITDTDDSTSYVELKDFVFLQGRGEVI
jgi:hypothetical protein